MKQMSTTPMTVLQILLLTNGDQNAENKFALLMMLLGV